MFTELTDEEISRWKAEISEFLRSNHSMTAMSDSHTGLSITLTQQNAWKLLEELTKEQRRRRRGNNPFIAIDLRNV